MRAHRETLLRTYLAHERWRVDREDAYADTYRQCGRGLTGLADAPGLEVLLAPVWTDVHRQTEAKLQNILRSRFETAGETCNALISDLSSCIMDFLLREQAVLRTAVAVQNDINRLLGRERPKRAISAADMKVYSALLGPDLNHLPHLIDELERLLGVHIDLDMDILAITRRDMTA